MALKRQDYLQTNLNANVMHKMESLLKYLRIYNANEGPACYVFERARWVCDENVVK